MPKALGVATRQPGLTEAFEEAAEALDRRIGWDRLPLPAALATIVGLRHTLRARNLYDTRPLPGGEPPLPPKPDNLAVRNADGMFNDLQDPAMGDIVITHGQRSHLGGLAALKRATDATLFAHEREADIVAGERKAQPIGFIPHRPFKAYVPLQVGLALGMGAHPPCAVDRLVGDGDAVGPLEVVLAPGHSPGHLAFYWEDRKALFAGDAIATWPELAPGWPAFNLNPRQHRQSLIRLARFDSAIVAVGHGDPVTARGTATVRSMVSRAVG